MSSSPSPAPPPPDGLDPGPRRELATRLRGAFLAFDGPDGTGKSTQVRRLERMLGAAGCDLLRVRDPGGTEIGERIRALVLDGAHEEMALETELFLFMASRAQLVREVIVPALDDGYTVIADRFLASTIAYQGGTEEVAEVFGFPVVSVDRIRALGELALGSRFPPYATYIFDVDVDQSLRRMHSSGELARHGGRTLHAPGADQLFLFGDRMEYRAARFQHKVRHMYRWLLEHHPREFIRVDANGTMDEVFVRLVAAICRQQHVRTADAPEGTPPAPPDDTTVAEGGPSPH